MWMYLEKRPRTVLLAVFVLAVCVRFGAIWALRDSLNADPDGYRTIARGIAAWGIFGCGDTPTAWRPPLYPVVLAPLMRFDPTVTWSVGVLQGVLGVATVLLTWRVARDWGLSVGGAMTASLLVAFDPILLQQSTLVMTETLATLLAVLGLWALTQVDLRSSLSWALLAGLLLGLACLCRPTFLVWGALCMAALLIRIRPTAHGVVTAAAFGSAVFVMMLPWIVRNKAVFDRSIIATTHGGFTVRLANNDDFYDYTQRGPWRGTWDADAFYARWASERPTSPQEELAIDAECRRRALETIRNRPMGFVWASVVRVGRLWQVLPYRVGEDESAARMAMRWAVAAWYVVVFTAAIVGAWRVRCRVARENAVHGQGPPTWMWGALLLIAFTAVHAVYWSNMRMRAPVMPVVALLAAAAIDRKPSREGD